MCKLKKHQKTSNVRIDKCMINLIKHIKEYMPFEVLACCCGHGKYPMTIVGLDKSVKFGFRFELLSDVLIPRTRRFYKRDKQGYYYIPETLK